MIHDPTSAAFACRAASDARSARVQRYSPDAPQVLAQDAMRKAWEQEPHVQQWQAQQVRSQFVQKGRPGPCMTYTKLLKAMMPGKPYRFRDLRAMAERAGIHVGGSTLDYALSTLVLDGRLSVEKPDHWRVWRRAAA